MTIKRFGKVFLPIGVFLFLLLVIFFCRKPVILVTDNAFNALYGQKRSQFKLFALSISLARPIKTIAIAPGAGPDLVAQGAASLSRRPFAVFFPFRYREAALRYQSTRPGSVVVILAGRKTQDSWQNYQEDGPGTKLLWIYTDTETDLYRAGAFAGFLAHFTKENQEYGGDGAPATEIAVFHDGLKNEEENAFLQGLEAQQWFDTPLFSPDLAEINLICAILMKETRFSEEEKARSLILFSWIDPVLAPRKALAIFDDSPWTQIGPALDLIKTGRTNGLIPSEIFVRRGDKLQKSVYNEINRLKTLKKGAENFPAPHFWFSESKHRNYAISKKAICATKTARPIPPNPTRHSTEEGL